MISLDLVFLFDDSFDAIQDNSDSCASSLILSKNSFAKSVLLLSIFAGLGFVICSGAGAIILL